MTAPSHVLQVLERYADSMKDLKQLLGLDSENSAAKTEYAEVKQLWEKQLRHLQEKKQHSKEKTTHFQKNKGRTEERKKSGQSDQQQELKQLLAETKHKMKELKKEVRHPMTFSDNEYLTANKTTYYDSTTLSQTATEHKKVVTEEPLSQEPKPQPTKECNDRDKRTPSDIPFSTLVSLYRGRALCVLY